MYIQTDEIKAGHFSTSFKFAAVIKQYQQKKNEKGIQIFVQNEGVAINFKFDETRNIHRLFRNKITLIFENEVMYEQTCKK